MGKTMHFWRPRPKQTDNGAADKLLIKVRGDSGHPKYPCALVIPLITDTYTLNRIFDNECDYHKKTYRPNIMWCRL